MVFFFFNRGTLFAGTPRALICERFIGFCLETLEFCVSSRGLLVLLMGFDLITDCKICVLIVFVFGGGGFWKSGHGGGF